MNRSEKVASDRVKCFLEQIDEQRYWNLSTEEEDSSIVGRKPLEFPKTTKLGAPSLLSIHGEVGWEV